MRSSDQHLAGLASRLELLLGGDTGLPWLRSMIYRQGSHPRKELNCGTPPEPLSKHIDRFHREWRSVLFEIASACPLVADSCKGLLQLDPLSKESDAAIERHVAKIRPVLSDPLLVRSLYRERDREEFGNSVAALRKERGWSVRQFAQECAQVARQMGFGVRAPDRHQIMDYEAGLSNAQPRTKVVLAGALGVAVDAL